MQPKSFNTVLSVLCASGLSLTITIVQAEPNQTGVCMRNVIAAYNDSKTASLVCLDQLEADINEGIETGLELSPQIIELRTQECQQLEMTKEQRKAAMEACRPQGN